MFKIARPDNPYDTSTSPEFGFRRKRFAMFEALVEPLMQKPDRTLRILDLGGTRQYWAIATELLEKYRGRISVHLVNQEKEPINNDPVFTQQTADACARYLLQGDRFDIVHSNSVIEHVGDWERIAAFADNVHRLGDRHFIQTPNYWFPLEPHFRFPAFQWLPASARTWLLQKRRLGFYDQLPEYLEARTVIDSIRLFTPHEMRQLFPGSQCEIEWVYGLPKSIVMIGGGHEISSEVRAPALHTDLTTIADKVTRADA